MNVVSWMKRKLSLGLTLAAGALAGLAFMALASASIQFDEGLAPHMNKLSGAVAAGIGRKAVAV
jgi:hypothetical protein